MRYKISSPSLKKQETIKQVVVFAYAKPFKLVKSSSKIEENHY